MKRLVQPVLARGLGEAQRDPCVGDDFGSVVGEARGVEPVTQRVVGARGDSVAAMEICEGDPFRRIFRMEVEREPGDIGVKLAPDLLGRRLAEPAKGSDVVAPDEDRVVGHALIVYVDVNC